ncbi:Uncharacterised protein [Vibrio cholerae]|nr:Uncharacterised protein [Vibrio cholerae]CSC54616.1 Uncharacterised protein [Vibrio cholerae]CSC68034.1 Uncharacterised protein [Vibrio cholerae]
MVNSVISLSAKPVPCSAGETAMDFNTCPAIPPQAMIWFVP